MVSVEQLLKCVNVHELLCLMCSFCFFGRFMACNDGKQAGCSRFQAHDLLISWLFCVICYFDRFMVCNDGKQAGNIFFGAEKVKTNGGFVGCAFVFFQMVLKHISQANGTAQRFSHFRTTIPSTQQKVRYGQRIWICRSQFSFVGFVALIPD